MNIKHLELTQNVITRLANNSSQAKHWCMLVLGAIWGISLKEGNVTCFHVLGEMALIIAFWWLSSYYLQQERIFRKIYEYIIDPKSRTKTPLYPLEYDLNPEHYPIKQENIMDVMDRPSEKYFFVSLLVTCLLMNSEVIATLFCISCKCGCCH